MSEKAQWAADAIARHLKLNGARTTTNQIAAIRRVYGRAWKRHLTYSGNGALSVNDVADGVDLLLSRLLDMAQAEYEAAMTAPCSAGTLQPAVYHLKELQS